MHNSAKKVVFFVLGLAVLVYILLLYLANINY